MQVMRVFLVVTFLFDISLGIDLSNYGSFGVASCGEPDEEECESSVAQDDVTHPIVSLQHESLDITALGSEWDPMDDYAIQEASIAPGGGPMVSLAPVEDYETLSTTAVDSDRAEYDDGSTPNRESITDVFFNEFDWSRDMTKEEEKNSNANVDRLKGEIDEAASQKIAATGPSSDEWQGKIVKARNGGNFSRLLEGMSNTIQWAVQNTSANELKLVAINPYDRKWLEEGEGEKPIPKSENPNRRLEKYTSLVSYSVSPDEVDEESSIHYSTVMFLMYPGDAARAMMNLQEYALIWKKFATTGYLELRNLWYSFDDTELELVVNWNGYNPVGPLVRPRKRVTWLRDYLIKVTDAWRFGQGLGGMQKCWNALPCFDDARAMGGNRLEMDRMIGEVKNVCPMYKLRNNKETQPEFQRIREYLNMKRFRDDHEMLKTCFFAWKSWLPVDLNLIEEA